MCSIRAFLISFIILLACGCSKGVDPVSPADTGPQTSCQAGPGRVVLGAFDLTLGPGSQFSYARVRSTETHYNVTSLILPPGCGDCFTVALVNHDGEDWTFKLSVKNPSNLTVYDVRVTAVKQGDIILKNPTSYTKLFALPNDTNPVNPYIRFDMGLSGLGAGGQSSANVQFKKPATSSFSQIEIVVDASYPSLQVEPYKLDKMKSSCDELNLAGTKTTSITVNAVDWHNDTQKVTVDLSPIGGPSAAELTKTAHPTWQLDGVPYGTGGQGEGDYDLLISAFGNGNETDNYVHLSVGHRLGWARSWGGDSYSFIMAAGTAIDGSGNIYVIGTFGGTADFNPGAGVDIHKSVGAGDNPFLSKFDANGNFMWARTWEGAYCIGEGVTVDWAGNLYLTGVISGEAFLTKLDSDGNTIWTQTWKGANGLDVLADDTGNAYVAGGFDGTVDFDPGDGVDNHTSNGQSNAFLSKFDSSGNFIWARTWGGSGSDCANKISYHSSGNIYVTGEYTGTVDFDPGSGVDNHTSSGLFSEGFLSKFEVNGNFDWARTWGGGLVKPWGVRVDSLDNTYVVGSFADTVDFDPGVPVDNHVSNGDLDAFLSKFDSGGNFIWAKTWGGTSEDTGSGIALDGSGSVFVTGLYHDTVDFDPGDGVDEHSSSIIPGAYLSKLTSDGDFVWSKTWGDGYLSNGAEGDGVATDGAGNIHVIGSLRGTCDMDPGSGVNNHTSAYTAVDIFLSTFPPDGNW